MYDLSVEVDYGVALYLRIQIHSWTLKTMQLISFGWTWSNGPPLCLP
jgi:hypothetical protein